MHLMTVKIDGVEWLLTPRLRSRRSPEGKLILQQFLREVVPGSDFPLSTGKSCWIDVPVEIAEPKIAN